MKMMSKLCSTAAMLFVLLFSTVSLPAFAGEIVEAPCEVIAIGGDPVNPPVQATCRYETQPDGSQVLVEVVNTNTNTNINDVTVNTGGATASIGDVIATGGQGGNASATGGQGGNSKAYGGSNTLQSALDLANNVSNRYFNLPSMDFEAVTATSDVHVVRNTCLLLGIFGCDSRSKFDPESAQYNKEMLAMKMQAKALELEQAAKLHKDGAAERKLNRLLAFMEKVVAANPDSKAAEKTAAEVGGVVSTLLKSDPNYQQNVVSASVFEQTQQGEIAFQVKQRQDDLRRRKQQHQQQMKLQRQNDLGLAFDAKIDELAQALDVDRSCAASIISLRAKGKKAEGTEGAVLYHAQAEMLENNSCAVSANAVTVVETDYYCLVGSSASIRYQQRVASKCALTPVVDQNGQLWFVGVPHGRQSKMFASRH